MPPLLKLYLHSEVIDFPSTNSFIKMCSKVPKEAEITEKNLFTKELLQDVQTLVHWGGGEGNSTSLKKQENTNSFLLFLIKAAMD